MRVAVAGVIHEANSFAAHPTTINEFEKGVPNPPLCRGEAMFDTLKGLNIPVSGALDHFAESGVDVIPLLWAEGGAGGPVERAAFDALADELIDRLQRTGRIDGLFLDLHGAMIVDGVDDGDGELLRRIRAAIGPATPIFAALDLHANVSSAMVALSDFLYACRTYPHVDFRETGARVAVELCRSIASKKSPAKAFAQIDTLISSPMQATSLPAAANVFSDLKIVEDAHSGIASFCMGFPAGDCHDAGASFIAYANDQQTADHMAARLTASFARHREAFRLEALSEDKAVERAMAISAQSDRPVVIADVQDNAGGGASSDSTGFIRALIRSGAEGAVCGLLYDPEAAGAAHAAGLGADIQLSLGGKRGLSTDAPLVATCRIVQLGDGDFVCTGGYFRGVNPRLGPMAVVKIQEPASDVRIIISSERCQLADRAMFEAVELDPTDFRILVLKSTAHFRDAFDPIAAETIIGLSPGEHCVEPAKIPYRRIRPGVELGVGGPLSGMR